MNWTAYEESLLSLTLYREARGEPFQGKVAVIFSILNRVDKPSWWGHNISEVVTKRLQYSSMTYPKDPQLTLWPIRGDVKFGECMDIVTQVLSGRIDNPVPHADSYYSDVIPAPNWADNTKFVTQIGHHRFYNLDNDHEAEELRKLIVTQGV